MCLNAPGTARSHGGGTAWDRMVMRAARARPSASKRGYPENLWITMWVRRGDAPQVAQNQGPDFL